MILLEIIEIFRQLSKQNIIYRNILNILEDYGISIEQTVFDKEQQGNDEYNGKSEGILVNDGKVIGF